MRIAARRALVDKTRALTADPARLKEIQDAVPPPDAVVQFLGQLELLNGVPFNYVVADEGLLPSESIRFFQVDPNWIYALIEGAASIGCVSTSDSAHDAVTRPGLHHASTRAARSVRAHKGTMSADAPVSSVTSGFLLRSAVVSGWPGLEVTAYDKQGNVLPAVIRMERVAPTILLFWVEGVIDHVEIHEPPEAMHFGVDVLGGKVLRYVTVPSSAPPNTKPGTTIPNSSQNIPHRAKNVIAIDGLASILQQGLQTHQANQGSDGNARPFTSAEFALQMVEGTQSVVFINVPPPPQERGQ
jgi:hypothetical protein